MVARRDDERKSVEERSRYDKPPVVTAMSVAPVLSVGTVPPVRAVAVSPVTLFFIAPAPPVANILKRGAGGLCQVRQCAHGRRRGRCEG
jgi:hypothetical protein